MKRTAAAAARSRLQALPQGPAQLAPLDDAEAMAAAENLSVPVFVARQAIFDTNLRIFAYELLFRSCSQGPAIIENESSATAHVIANGLSIAAPQLDSRPAFINFPEELLIDGAPLALRPDACVIEILETVQLSGRLLKALKRYKEQGYLLALDDYVGQEELLPLLQLADIVKVDVMGMSAPEIIKLFQKLRAPGRTLLAEKISDRKTFELAAALGTRYFQGFYFCKPVVERGTTIKTGTATRLQMIAELSSDDYDVKKVSRVISHDPGLSYRLLKVINSPYFGFRGKVRSLEQAVALMGGKPLRQWLMLVMLADIGEGGRHEDLVFTSVCRGTFLERLARERPLRPYPPDTMFLVGLFSNLDALLNQSMEEIIPCLPLDNEVAAALLGRDNALRKYLDLRLFLETARWEEAEALIEEMRLQREKVAALSAQAAAWTSMMLEFEAGSGNTGGAPGRLLAKN